MVPAKSASPSSPDISRRRCLSAIGDADIDLFRKEIMKWIAPSEKDTGTDALEDRLWAAADQLRANSGLTPAQDPQPSSASHAWRLLLVPAADLLFGLNRAVLRHVLH